MQSILYVMAGGALGAGARFGVAQLLPWRGGLPWATLLVNGIGGFAMGILMALMLKGSASETMRLFIGVGILGGFTTFSAFGYETISLMQQGKSALAVGYVLASILIALAATWAGMELAR